MCRISLNINYFDGEGTGVLQTEAQYRKKPSLSWIPFPLDINDPKTPDLFVEGEYQLRIRLFNGYGWSAWFQSNFWIGCGEYDDGYNDDYKN